MEVDGSMLHWSEPAVEGDSSGGDAEDAQFEGRVSLTFFTHRAYWALAPVGVAGLTRLGFPVPPRGDIEGPGLNPRQATCHLKAHGVVVNVMVTLR